jgi:geranylgeranylglycerol-phosphate geranylgeranyltransferase
MRYLIDILRLARWQNCLIAAATVVVGAFLLPDFPPTGVVIMASLAAAFITAYGNIHNDVADIESDRINHPERPLASGRISRGSASILLLLFLVAGLVLASFLNSNAFRIAALVSIMLFLYSSTLKKIPLVANLWVALIGMLTFIYAGTLAQGYLLWDFSLVNAGALFAFCFHFGRELVKDLQDMEGDRAAGTKTLALTAPEYIPKALTTLAFLGLFIPAVGIYYFLKPSLIFPVTFIIGIIIPILVLIALLWSGNERRRYRSISVVLKALMPVGLFALLTARF